MKLVDTVPENPLLSQEPGIIRNAEGRIVATGYPHIPPRKWPIAYKEIAHSLANQVQMERRIARTAVQDVLGCYMTNGIVFNMAALSYSLKNKLEGELERMLAIEGEKPLVLGDIGGGEGGVLKNACWMYKDTKYRDPKLAPLKRGLHIIMTTLFTEGLRHTKELLVGIADEVRVMSIELPYPDIFRKFDILVAQNSVYFWSNFPELATLNLWKLLKPGGIAIVTIPSMPRLLTPRNILFNTRVHLRVSPYFDVTITPSKDSGGGLIAIMHRVDSPAV